MPSTLAIDSAAFEGLKELLQFRSVSSDPESGEECHACASWLRSKLQDFGFTTQLIPNGKDPPLLLAHLNVASPRDRVLLYAHYDVQAVGAEAAWRFPPFEPSIAEGRIWARGAADDKGQLWAMLWAIKQLIESNALGSSICILFEGEEETGSAGLTKALPLLAPQIKADRLLVCDTGMIGGKPTLMLGLRGIATLGIRVKGAERELHSGYHGALVHNPATALLHALAQLHAEDGSITLPHFYEQIAEYPVAVRELINQEAFDVSAYQAQVGSALRDCEQGYSPQECVGIRPSIDIHSLCSGDTSPGVKTAIPTEAYATLSARLVHGQDPEQILKALKDFVRARIPMGLKLEFSCEEGYGRALLVDSEDPRLQEAAQALTRVCNGQLQFRCHGASIPVLADLQHYSQALPIIAGFSQESDRIHATNESFGLERFGYCVEYLKALLSKP